MVEEQGGARGTRVHAPELDWNQVHETVLMLELAAGQIAAAMQESNAPVNTLTGGFTSLVVLLERIQSVLSSLPETPENVALKRDLLGSTDEVNCIVQQSVVAFQFYDKLSQRLDHVSHGLGQLAALVGDLQRVLEPREWAALQQSIRSRYSTPEEIAMFEAVLAGVPVQEALQQFMEEKREVAASNIELF
ncbi:MAG TPA: hypothetical protein VL550_08665 [Rhodocyclaceae bacterium]|jgi:hypothetical protein|nr:hypothetical protein [Rhodocyclaceae bacterium]